MRSLIKYNNKSRVQIIVFCSAIAIVAVGIAFAVGTIQYFQNGIEKDQDDQLERAIFAVDYNINDSVNRFNVQTGIFVNSERFSIAVNEWRETENRQTLERRIKNTTPGTMRSFENMFIEDSENEKSFAIDNKKYTISDNLKENLYRCTGENCDEYIAAKYELKDGINCYSILNIDITYNNALRRVNADDRNIMLYDGHGEVVYYSKSGEIAHAEADGIKDLSKTYKKEANFLLKSEESDKAISKTYEKAVTDKGERITSRIYAVPVSDTDNEIFAISVSADYHVVDVLISRTIGRLLISFALLGAGIITLILITVRISRARKQADMELENLMEKNRQMEELTKKTQELAHHQRLETIGTMTSGIAHEFNNLLTPIMGYSMMTLEKLPQDDDKIYDDVLEIYNASVKAKDIISRLSELARKNTEMVFKNINPDELANRVINVLGPSLPKNVDIVRDFNCQNCNINGNEVQLSQLLLNLLINAFQELKESGGVVTIRTLEKENEVLFVVKDNGRGISEEVKERMFEPFFTTKESGAGTGLGLAIAMQAVEDHGGKLELISELGEGAEFRVYIPKAKEQG